ncbi:ATP-dependent helicase [Mesorhizobium caraganae]|uniref:ATP-dependent helicase n=1 Tax=Mesorhizobium caraganae TaxID=483206 RepID=UPI0019395607|nr:ATP-dependent helicase [Mesorhizobium caraganae]MBM2711048.1 ATP-dependent helicase [Mesorhizobium caraganae]
MSDIDLLTDNLTPVQRAAVEWDNGALLLLAGPGSGKTHVLTTRMARLLLMDPDGKWRQLALTFTRRAADEMRSRLEQLAPNLSARVYIGTFHSFAAELLRQSGSHVGVKTDFKIYSAPADRELLLAEALKEADLQLADTLPAALSVIDGLRDRLASPENCLRFFKDQHRGERYAAAYSAYLNYLDSENALDFHGLLLKAYQLLADFPTIAERYRKTYKYISVDEFQDTNYAQYSILRALTGNSHRNVFIVADDDQIIYQWNGASPQRLHQTAQDYEATTLQMPTNFRCPSDVIAMANKLVSHNQFRTPGKDPLAAAKGNFERRSSVRVLRFDTDQDEATGVANDIKENHRGQLHRVGVLARTKATLALVEKELTQVGIKSKIAQRRDNFASLPYQWLHVTLALAARRSDVGTFKSFVDASNALMRLKLIDSVLISDANAGNGDLLKAWIKGTEEFNGDELHFSDLIRSLKTDLGERTDLHKFLRFVTTEFKAKYEELQQTFSSFDEDRRAWSQVYREIVLAIGRDASLDTFIEELDFRSKEPPLDENTVPLLTIHASKGNEFDHVYLLGMAEDVLPSIQSKRQGDKSPQMEEERRNCFVAITRCRLTLTFSYAKTYFGRPKDKSRFLSEMDVFA